jgi:four helix bundle protein
MAFRDFTNCSIWKKALSLLLSVYEITKHFPPDERYLLVSDMRRAGNSVLHNFAEGFGRYGNRDKSKFYKISRGSAYELIGQLHTSKALRYCEEPTDREIIDGYKDVIDELDRLINSVESR